MSKARIYALYKNDEMLALGTLYQIAIKMNVSMKTLEFYLRPAYKRRCKGSKNRRELIELKYD